MTIWGAADKDFGAIAQEGELRRSPAGHSRDRGLDPFLTHVGPAHMIAMNLCGLCQDLMGKTRRIVDKKKVL